MENKKIIVDNLDLKYDGRSLRKEIRINYPTFYTEIIKYTIGDSFIAKVFSIVNNITEYPKCKECKTKKTKFFSYKTGYRDFCCGKCSSKYTSAQTLLDYNTRHGSSFTNIRQFPIIKEKADNTLMKKYGTLMPMNEHIETVNRIKRDSVLKHGTEFPAASKQARDKAKETMYKKSKEEKLISRNKYDATMLTNFGETNPMKVIELFNKAKVTRLQKYGVEYCLQNPELAKEVSEKTRKTLFLRYGSANQMDAPGAKEKFRKHNLMKFGVQHPMQLKEYQEKCLYHLKKHYLKDTEFIIQCMFHYLWIRHNNMDLELKNIDGILVKHH